jgi:hypothetical protein
MYTRFGFRWSRRRLDGKERSAVGGGLPSVDTMATVPDATIGGMWRGGPA